MKSTLEKHDVLLSRVFGSHNGHIFKTGGDGFYVAFASPLEGLQAAIGVQRALQQETWGPTPIRVRIGLHSGEAQARDGDFFGPTLNRVARLMAAGHGGQVLVSNTTRELVYQRLPQDISLINLGEQRLKDLVHPERIYQALAPDLPADFPPLRTLEAFRHNLPTQLTPFIGRQKALAMVGDLLLKNRLLTLTGPGGIGKTRLSLQAAAENLEQFQDGVWFVELAPVTEPALVGKTVLNTLGLREEVARPAQQVLNDFFGARRSLLIFDNCEHLVEACAALVDELLQACPDLTLMASSREALGVPGEAVYAVPTMAVREAGPDADLEEQLRSEAVQLFVERARAALPDFQINTANAGAVLQVCSRLDGIPLAIELAAARVNLLQVEGIAARLDDAFSLLKSSRRRGLPHHQTLRATIDWSYELLTAPEKNLLNRLSVFVGGWTLEAAEQVCVGDGIASVEVLDLLAQLAAKSLLRIDREQGREPRYHLLDTVRLYTQEKLEQDGGLETWQQRHLVYFRALSDSAEQRLYGPEQRKWIKKLEREVDNLNAALQSCTKSKRNLEMGMVLAANLGWFWYARGYLQEGLLWLQKLLENPGARERTLLYARALRAGGLLSTISGHLVEATDWNEQALEIFQNENHQKGIAEAWALRGAIAMFSNYEGSDPAAAEAVLKKSLDLATQIRHQWIIGEAHHLLGHVFSDQSEFSKAAGAFKAGADHFRKSGNLVSIVHPLNDLGLLTIRDGDLETASGLFKETLEISREIGHAWGMSLALRNLGRVAFLNKDYQTVVRYFRESLAIAHDIGAKRTIGENLTWLGYAWAAIGENEEWPQLLGAAVTILETLGTPRLSAEQAVLDERIEATGQDPSGEFFRSKFISGRNLTITEAIELALENHYSEEI